MSAQRKFNRIQWKRSGYRSWYWWLRGLGYRRRGGTWGKP